MSESTQRTLETHCYPYCQAHMLRAQEFGGRMLAAGQWKKIKIWGGWLGGFPTKLAHRLV